MSEFRQYCTVWGKKIEKYKNEYETTLSRAFDRALSIICKPDIFSNY
jgi:hypothetical protein